ncbi:hypothetical protein V6N13_055084 [Hibiscus sabdariffa]
MWKAFVDNLSKQVSRSALKELFNHHGKVVWVYFPEKNMKAKYKSLMFAFVSSASSGDLTRAIRGVNKTFIDGV